MKKMKLLKLNPMKIASPLEFKPIMPIGETKEGIPEEKFGAPMGGINLGLGPQKRVLPDAGNQPDPTPEKIREYKKNQFKTVEKVVLDSLRKHPQDVLHGSQSLKKLLPQYSRNPQDWDILSPMEKKRALALEAEIDRRAGCNIAETRYMEIPKVSMTPDDPRDSKELYQVVTPLISGDPSIDVMDRPKGIHTIRRNGITHESLQDQYDKAKKRQMIQPTKAHKARSDQMDIERYWESKGKKIRR